MSKKQESKNCEHNWQPNEISNNEVEAVMCLSCGQRELRYIIVKNPNFPVDKFPEL